MNIYVVNSVGEGRTLLSSYDKALQNLGVCNYNLIHLSSIIPPKSKIIETEKYKTPLSEFGHKLYVVISEMRSNEAGMYISAGIGWYQLEDGGGYFVEHSVIGQSKSAVKREIDLLIHYTLQDMCEFRGKEFKENNVKSSISISKINNKPKTVMAIAVYKSEAWE